MKPGKPGKQPARRRGRPIGNGYQSKLPPISFRLREDQRKELQALAKKSATTVSDLSRQWVLEMMAERSAGAKAAG